MSKRTSPFCGSYPFAGTNLKRACGSMNFRMSHALRHPIDLDPASRHPRAAQVLLPAQRRPGRLMRLHGWLHACLHPGHDAFGDLAPRCSKEVDRVELREPLSEARDLIRHLDAAVLGRRPFLRERRRDLPRLLGDLPVVRFTR